MRFAGVVLIIAAAATLLTGCLIPPGTEADPARQRAWAEVESLAEEVGRSAPPPIATARYDACESRDDWSLRKERMECGVARSVLLPVAAAGDSVPAGLRRMAARLDELGCRSGYGYDRKARSQWAKGILTPAEITPDVEEYEVVTADCAAATLTISPVGPRPCRRSPPPCSCLEGTLGVEGSNGLADARIVEEPYPPDSAGRARAGGAALFWIVTAQETYHSAP